MTKFLDHDSARALATKLAHEAVGLKGTDIRILDVADLLYITDYFVIVTTHSQRQTRAMADALKVVAKSVMGSKGQAEGDAHSSWVLCDFGAVVVQILTEDAREFYGLDELWADAEEVEFDPAA